MSQKGRLRHLPTVTVDSGSDSRSDVALLRASRRDTDAFCAFYCRHAEAVYRFFRRAVNDGETASDLTAETFAEVLRTLRRFRGEQDDAGVAWLYGIARNLLRQYYRRSAVATAARREIGMRLRTYAADDYDEVEERVSAEGFRAALAVALQELPAGQREAVELRIVEDLGYDEVAARLNTSQLSARMRVSRALRALNTRLKGASP